MFGRHAIAPPSPRPAHALWQQPTLVDAIVDAAQEQDLAALKATCVTLARAVDRPALWARRYAPCRVDFANRFIITGLRLGDSPTDDGKYPGRLGLHAGHVWHLLGGHDMAMPEDRALTTLVDEGMELMELQAHAGGRRVLPRIHALIARDDINVRQIAWRLLITMGYRLRLQAHASRPKTMQLLQPTSLTRSPGCMLGALAVWTLATLALRCHEARSITAPLPCLWAVAVAAASTEATSLLVVVTCLMVHTSQVRADQAAARRLQAIATTVYQAAVAAG